MLYWLCLKSSRLEEDRVCGVMLCRNRFSSILKGVVRSDIGL